MLIKMINMTTTIKRFKPIEKNGKVHSLSYSTPQEAIRAVGGVGNLKELKEVNEVVKVPKQAKRVRAHQFFDFKTQQQPYSSNILEYTVLATKKGQIGLVDEIRVIDFERELSADWLNDKQLTKAADVIASSNKMGVALDYSKYIASNIYNTKSDMVYVIVIGGYVVKIGKTETGLCGRWGSYQNGGKERRKDVGNGSVTNHYVMMAIKSAVEKGLSVEWYIKYMDKTTKEVNVLGVKQIEHVYSNGTCDTWEKTLLGLYQKQTGNYPALSSNA